MRLALWVGAVAVVLLLALGVARLVLSTAPDRLVGLEAIFWRLKYAGLALQLAAALFAFWRWPALVAWAIRRGSITERARPRALAARNRAVLMLLALVS